MVESLPEVRIGLLWHSMTSDNMGVGALTLSHMAIIEDLARELCIRPRFMVIGWADTRPAYVTRDNIAIRKLRLADFVKPRGGLLGALRRCDVILDIGAGDSFADIYGTRRIATVAGSKLLALFSGRPLILSPQTVGPFESRLWRRVALALVRRAQAVATRDDLSTGFLRQIGYRGEIVEATDVALRLPCDPPAAAKDGPVRVGLNVSGLLFNGGYTGENMFGLRSSYPELIRSVIRHFTSLDGVELHLVSHVLSKTFAIEDDHRVGQALAAEFPQAVLAPAFNDPVEAKTYIAGLDFFMGARMHACIAAFSAGVPVLPMAYSRKFAGFFGTLGYDTIADCREETGEAILAKVRDAFESRAALREEVAAARARGLTRLGAYEAVLRGFLHPAPA